MYRRKLHSFTRLVICLAALALAASCGHSATNQPTPSSVKAKPAPASTPAPKEPLGCGAELVAQIRAAAGPVELRPDMLDDDVQKVLGHVDEIRRCERERALADSELREVLLILRNTIKAWYAMRPDVRAAQLTGESKNITISESGKPPRTEEAPSRLDWARHYVYITSKVLGIKAPPGAGKREEEILRRPAGEALMLAMLRVDALTGDLIKALNDPSRSGRGEGEVEALLQQLREAMADEATFWTNVPPQGAVERAFLPLEADEKNAGDLRVIRLTTRVERVSEHVHKLASSWTYGAIERLRRGLGDPYRNYLATIAAKQSVPSAAKIKWVLPVAFMDDTGTRHDTTELSIDAILRYVIDYDRGNVRGLFAMLTAERAWRTVLPLDESSVASAAPPSSLAQAEGGVSEAINALVRAFEQTESDSAKLAGVAHAVSFAGLITEAEGKDTKESPGQPADADRSQRRNRNQREFASRRMAEVALCLMNRAYLQIKDSPSCTFIAKAVPPYPAPMSCVAQRKNPGLASAPFLWKAEAGRGYGRVISALTVNSRAGALGPGPLAVSPAALCEMGYFFAREHFDDLHINVAAYSDAIVAVAKFGPNISDAQAAGLVQGALDLAGVKRDAVCRKADVKVCSISEIRRLQQDTNTAALARQYCQEAVGHGADVFLSLHTKPQGGGLELMQRIRGSLSPPEETTILRAGMAMDAEDALCSKAPPESAAEPATNGQPKRRAQPPRRRSAPPPGPTARP